MNYIINKGKFFNEKIVILEEKKDESLIKLGQNYDLIVERKLIIPNSFIEKEDIHNEKIQYYYDICRYLTKLCQNHSSTIKLKRLSLNSIFLFINFNYFKKYGKQLFEDVIMYEKYKLGYFNPYMKYSTRVASNYSSYLNDFTQDNYIPIELSFEQEEFILNVVLELMKEFPHLEWLELYNKEETMIHNDKDFKLFMMNFMYESDLSKLKKE